MLFLSGKEAYELFLESPFWQQMAWEKKRGRCCERCGSKERLQAHHRFYREHWFDTRLDDLEVLCRKCHELEHGIKPRKPSKKKQRRRDAFKKCGLKRRDVGQFRSFRQVKKARAKGLITRDQYLILKEAFGKCKKPNQNSTTEIKTLTFHLRTTTEWINPKASGS